MPRVRIKICGITNARDAVTATMLGADAIGLNFHPASPRFVSDLAEINRILNDLPPVVDTVGVFVAESWQEACARSQYGLRTIQMHGFQHEHGFTFPFKRIEAFRLRDAACVQEMMAYLEAARELGQLPSAVLVDAFAPAQHGGTGLTAPWGLLADLQLPVPLILAGGLTPDNVAEAVRVVKPWMVDVASGVESAPGIKDADKMRRFIDAV